MSEFVDYYSLISELPDASVDSIEKALKTERRIWQARQNAPDVDVRHETEKRLGLLRDAKNILLNESLRAEYDKYYLKNLSKSKQTANSTSSRDSKRNIGFEEALTQAEDYFDQKLYDLAKVAAEEAALHSSESSRLWDLRARISFVSGDSTTAIYQAKQAIRISPREIEPRELLVEIFTTEKMFEDAESQLQELIKVGGDEWGRKIRIAQNAAAQGKLEKALSVLDEMKSDVNSTPTQQARLRFGMAELIPVNRKESSYSVTSKQEIRQMQLLIDEGRVLNEGNEELNQDFEELETYLKLVRKWSWNKPTWAYAIVPPWRGVLI